MSEIFFSDRFVLMPIGEIRNGLIKIEKTTESNGIESIFADDQHIKFSSALIGLKANIDPIEWKNNSIIKFTDTLIFVRDGKLFLDGKSKIKIPSVVVLKDYVKPQKSIAFTRFNLFLRD
mgnify:CR=1 FL=1